MSEYLGSLELVFEFVIICGANYANEVACYAQTYS